MNINEAKEIDYEASKHENDYKPNIIFTTYSKAQSELAKGKGRNPRSRKVANNTYLIEREGYIRDIKGIGHSEPYIAVRLHSTDIVDIYLDKLILHTGGWMTNTTKERINRYLPPGWYLYTERRIWYLSHATDKWQFKDGISIHQDGWVYGFERSATKMKRRSKLVKEFANAFVEKLVNGEINPPSNGDCWYCLFKDEGGRTMGDLGGSDHMLKHVENEYYVPSIIMNALDELGGSPVAREWVWSRMNQVESRYGSSFSGVATDQVKRILIRYVSRKVGLGG